MQNKDLKKINFFQGFWCSVLELDSYKYLAKSSWLHTCFHVFCLSFISALAFCHFLHWQVITPAIKNLLKDIPDVRIESQKSDNKMTFKAVFDPSIKLPYVISVGIKNKNFRFILDDGQNINSIAERYENYLLITHDEIISRVNGKALQGFKFDDSKIEGLKMLFGERMIISKDSLANIISKAILFQLLAFTLVPPLLFPLPFFIFIITSLNSLIFASLVFAGTNSSLSYKEIVKASFFAATPGVIVQSLSLLLLSGFLPWITLFACVFLQIGYLHSGVNSKENNK